MIQKVISGGQTGADIGGLLAAKLHGIETGGWMPKGWITHDDSRPEYKTLFGMQESTGSYSQRTRQNVEDSDGTIRFACNFKSPGEICTLKAIKKLDKPYFDVPIEKDDPVLRAKVMEQFTRWIKDHGITTLNVAGNSHRTWRHMQSYVVRFLSTIFFSFGFNYKTLSQDYEKFANARTW